MQQISFDPLDLMDQNPQLSAIEAHKIMRSERDKTYRTMKREGVHASRWVLKGQIRPYRGLGQPDGSIRDVYFINQY